MQKGLNSSLFNPPYSLSTVNRLNYIIEGLFSFPISVVHSVTHYRFVLDVVKVEIADCPDHPMCIFYPFQVSHGPKFVVCGKTPEVLEMLPPPDVFMSFICSDKTLIPAAAQCDGYNNCPHAEDEQNCDYVCTLQSSDCFINCLQSHCACQEFYYQCMNGGCIPFHKFCDDQINCKHGDDEYNCIEEIVKHSTNDSTSLQYVNPGTVNTGYCSGGVEFIPCKSDGKCVHVRALCHYDSLNDVLSYCTDGSHLHHYCADVVCNQGFKCYQSYCIPTRKLCDGVMDCPSGDDEDKCVNMTCPGHLRCYNTSYCVPPWEICDGIEHCPGRDDEYFCQQCPQECTCRGNMISCSNVQPKSHITILLNSPAVLILHNSTSVFYNIVKLYSDKLTAVYQLVIRGGSKSSIWKNDIGSFEKFLRLRFLEIINLDVNRLPSYFLQCTFLLKLNLSSNMINIINQNAFYYLDNLKVLVLSLNRIDRLEWHFSKDLKSLEYLDLSDNPLFDIFPAVFIHNHNLLTLRSDWYIVCCVAIQVDDCQPQEQFVSSCSQLFSSTIQKVLIIGQGIVSILANGLVLACRMHTREADNVPVISLAIADSFMGLYLVSLACIDFVYNDRFYLLISQWTKSALCWAVGGVNFVSSEASLFVIVILSLGRILTLRKIGGLKFVKKQLLFSCLSAWVCTVIVALTYVAYLHLNKLQLRNNMCLILALSQKTTITLFEYIYQIGTITLDVACLMLLCICSASILIISSSSNRKCQQMSANSPTNRIIVKLAKKIIILIFCNALCWIPILTVAALLLLNVNVNENIINWIAILIIPISSTTNPFLYSGHIFTERMKTFLQYCRK